MIKMFLFRLGKKIPSPKKFPTKFRESLSTVGREENKEKFAPDQPMCITFH